MNCHGQSLMIAMVRMNDKVQREGLRTAVRCNGFQFHSRMVVRKLKQHPYMKVPLNRASEFGLAASFDYCWCVAAK